MAWPQTLYLLSKLKSLISNLTIGTASVDDVLDGKTFASGSENSMLVGAMPNRGAWVGNADKSGNVIIPAGYHNGSGYVSAHTEGRAYADIKFQWSHNDDGDDILLRGINLYVYDDTGRLVASASSPCVENIYGTEVSFNFNIAH
jgi:hypothetical protein